MGHRNDPVAATCHYVFDGSWAGPTPANASAVDECRTQFVVVELRDARMP